MVGLCNIATFDRYMLRLPNFPLYLQKNVNICEIDVSSLDFRVNSRLGGHVSWTYIDFSFFCCCIDSIGTCEAIYFYSIWCWAPIVLGHELGQVRDLSLCPFFGDQIHVILHLFIITA
jgi:hypothetical protein